MTGRRAWSASVAVVALVAGVLTGVATSAASTHPEQVLLAKINAERQLRGIAPVQLSAAVSDRVSRPWSRHMADRAAP